MSIRGTHVYPRCRERTHSTVKKLFAFMVARESIAEQRMVNVYQVFPLILSDMNAYNFNLRRRIVAVKKKYLILRVIRDHS